MIFIVLLPLGVVIFPPKFTGSSCILIRPPFLQFQFMGTDRQEKQCVETAPSLTSKFGRYFSDPSTHGGLYFAGLGGMVGWWAGVAREIQSAVIYDAPKIVSAASCGSWQEAAYCASEVAIRVATSSATVATACGGIGYVGGYYATKKLSGLIGILSRTVFGHRD
jgi:hypothetical protein